MLNETEIGQQLKDMENHYALTHNQMRRGDLLHEQEYERFVDVPYEVRIYKSSTPTKIIDGFRNQIRTNEPTVNVRPFGTSDKASKEALLMQKWGYGTLEQERVQGVMDPNAQCAMDLLLRGAACKKIVVDVDRMIGDAPRKGTKAYREWELRAARTWPFHSIALDPLTVFPSPGQRKPFPFMIEQQQRFAGDLWAQYPDWEDPRRGSKDGDKPSRPVVWIEYWDNSMYYLVADGVFVQQPKVNPYGFVPYIYEWSGMGRSHADGDPVHLAVGILTNIEGELIQEVQLKTAISVQTQMHVFPPILTTDDARKVARQFGVGPGKVIQHAPNNPPTYMDYPPPNENHYRFLEQIEGNIARVMSPALSGGSDSSVRYGVLNAQRIGQALTTIAPVRATLNSIGTQTLNMMSQMANVMKLDMAVSGTQESVGELFLIKGDTHKHQNFDVTFEAVDPSENDRALLIGQAMRRSGDISQRTFWEVYAKDTVRDPDEEEARLDEEKVMLQLFESGVMMESVLSEEVNDELGSGDVSGVRDAIGETVRGGGASTPGGEAQASQARQLAGTSVDRTAPRAIEEAGRSTGRPSQTGVPGR